MVPVPRRHIPGVTSLSRKHHYICSTRPPMWSFVRPEAGAHGKGFWTGQAGAKRDLDAFVRLVDTWMFFFLGTAASDSNGDVR